MSNKSRLIFIQNYLYEHTDAGHPVSSTRLRELLEENGFTVGNRTIKSDIETLIANGHDIITSTRNGKATQYSFGSRGWEPAEVRFLIDAVASNRFLSLRKSTQLIEKLSRLCGDIKSEAILSEACTPSRRKSAGNRAFYTLQRVGEAVSAGKKLAFRYFDYDIHKKPVPRHGGELYVVSPFGTVWTHDRHYMIAFSERRSEIVPFRIDHMEMPLVLDEDAAPAPKGFDLTRYTDTVYKMYAGPECRVTLLCSGNMVNHIIDHFGESVPLADHGDGRFTATARAEMSPTFFAWLLQYTPDITILEPPEARDAYRELLAKALQSTQPDSEG